MKLDETLIRILKEIQEEVSVQFGTTISIEQLHSIIETQEESTKLGIAKGLTVHWIRFGKFIYTDRTKTRKEIKKVIQNLEENDDILPHEKIAITKKLIIEKAEQKRAKISESTDRVSKPMDVETVMNTTNMYKLQPRMFVSLVNKQNKS